MAVREKIDETAEIRPTVSNVWVIQRAWSGAMLDLVKDPTTLDATLAWLTEAAASGR
jgi:hypothetical protein